MSRNVNRFCYVAGWELRRGPPLGCVADRKQRGRATADPGEMARTSSEQVSQTVESRFYV